MIKNIPVIKNNKVISIYVIDTDREDILLPKGCIYGLEGGNVNDTTEDGGKTYTHPEPIVTDEDRADQLQKEMYSSDRDMARIGEDMLSILIKKGIISLDDFSDAAKSKLTRRAGIREQLRAK